MPKVSLIILNWNRFEITRDCLKSVAGLDTSTCELDVIVVDNASTDGSVEKLKKTNISNIKFQIIENNINLGFTGGNNVGMKYALTSGADYIILLNNDCILDKSLLTHLVKFAQKHKKAGSVSPKIYFAKGYEFHKKRYKKDDLGKVIWYAGGKIDWDNVMGINLGVDEVDKGQFDKEGEIDFATGACVLYTKDVLEEVGLYDEKYFMYLEDADFSVRMKSAGWKVMYTPTAKLWHKVAQSSGIGSDLNDYFISRNRLLFGYRYANLRTKFALLRESGRLLFSGRKWQKIGVKDYYLGKLGKGSWK